MTIYSPQMFNTYTECPAKYYFRYVKNINIPQLDNTFVLGKNIHALAAYYLKRQDISLFTLSEKEQEMWNRLLNMKYFKYKTEQVESNISCKINNIWIGGRIDALVKDENNEYYILDYKTGEIPTNSEYNFQTIIYLLCCDALIKDYNSLNFVYLSVKTGETKNIKFSEKLKNEYIQKITEVYDNIQKLYQPQIIKNEKCTKCSYQKICV